jgi:two-component system NtrC family sensor kinase
MKLSKRNRIVLSFVLVALCTGIIIGFIVNSVIARRVIGETQERVKEALNGAQWLYTARINEIDRAIYLTSIRYVLRGALKKESAFFIKDDMKRLIGDYGLDFLTLVDKRGIVLFRFHNPVLSGDSLIRDPFISEALKNKGISGTQVLTRPELLKEGKLLADRAVFYSIPTPKEKPTEELMESSGMVLKSAHPVLDANGKVLGALMGGILINRNYEIVDRIKSILFKDAKYKGKEIGTATIFLGDLRISTNVIDREGNRATGTRAMREVGEQVLGKGLPWIHRAFVVDDWYITAYEPIHDIQDKIVGMLYVGILENKYIVLKERLVLLFMVGMLIAVLVFSALKFWKRSFARIFIPARRKLLKKG